MVQFKWSKQNYLLYSLLSIETPKAAQLKPKADKKSNLLIPMYYLLAAHQLATVTPANDWGRASAQCKRNGHHLASLQPPLAQKQQRRQCFGRHWRRLAAGPSPILYWPKNGC